MRSFLKSHAIATLVILANVLLVAKGAEWAQWNVLPSPPAARPAMERLPPTQTGRDILPVSWNQEAPSGESTVEVEQDSTDDADSSVQLVSQLEPGGPAEAGAGLSLQAGGGGAGLSGGRRSLTATPGAGSVGSREAQILPPTDGGGLLGNSSSVVGVSTQQRNKVTTDVRVRGSHVGELLASGSYWIPARADLDTMLNKIDSRAIQDMVVIKGPYSARLGPGFNFVDFSLFPAPRFDGYESGGMTSLDYGTNGENFYGRQSLWAGSNNWGMRFSYGHATGNDYTTGYGSGAQFELPSSYNSRDLDAALGYDLGDDQHLEFRYLRLDQTGVEYPGMVFDINFLKTEAFELNYISEDQPHYDRFELEGWYNRTIFQGDTLGAGKNRQIPTLRSNLFPYDGSGDPANIPASIMMPGSGVGTAFTDVDAMSTGYSAIFDWGGNDDPQLAIGTDFRYVDQELNDIENQRPDAANNFPIPPSFWANPGILAEYSIPVKEYFTVNMGGRFDVVMTDAQDSVPGVGTTTGGPPPAPFVGTPILITDRLRTDRLDQNFELWSYFATFEGDVTEHAKLTGGFGFAQRAPTLTELYAAGSFINLLQSGLTTLTGDPELRKESLRQIDLGMVFEYPQVKAGVNGFYSWIHDYITFDGGTIADPANIGQINNRMTVVNTDLATITGFELYGEWETTSMIELFATLSYQEGRDLTRTSPSRIRGVGFRSDSSTPAEPLPGIAPLNSRVGVRWHSPQEDRPWSIELMARIFDHQNKVAYELYERPTPGYTVFNLRTYWQVNQTLMLTAGIENFTNKFYRDHLDYRAGLGVFQPGINGYFGTQLTY